MAHKAALPTLAKSIVTIINGTDPLAARIRDRSFLLTEKFVNQVTSLLRIGYPGRRPRRLVNAKGKPRPTDMDLASFLVHLLEKPTILELPSYTTALPRMVFASERHLSDRRYGNLLSLSSHRENLSFGVTIEDMSLMQRSPLEEDVLGSPRTFLIVGYDGNWHKGWQGVSWQFRRHEQDFRDHYELSADSEHRGYQYFAHPNRRHSIFSRAHLLLKLLWQRLDDEISHHGCVESTRDNPIPAVRQERGKHCLVPTFTMSLAGLPLQGTYPVVHDDWGDYTMGRLQFLKRMRIKVQFLVRLNEYAFYQYGRERNYVAHWVKGGCWHHFDGTSPHRRHATLTLASGVALGYTTDTVSKKVAAR